MTSSQWAFLDVPSPMGARNSLPSSELANQRAKTFSIQDILRKPAKKEYGENVDK